MYQFFLIVKTKINITILSHTLRNNMSGGLYGGDEVGAVVFDVGSYSTRVGFAGEDTPKGEICSTLGVIKDAEHSMDIEETNGTKLAKRRYHFDPQHLVPIANKEMVNFLKDGMIDDWELFEQMLNHIYKDHVRDSSSPHPVLMSEPPWNTKEKREKLTELMFEKYDIPAFFLCKNAVLSAYAHGRSTGLIVDSGATHTTAVPVHDGFVLQKGVIKSPLGGDVLTGQCTNVINSWGADIVPTYLVKSKEEVQEGEPAKYTRREMPPLTESFTNFMQKELARDFQKSVLQISDIPFQREELETVPGVLYDFPNGYSRQISVERFRISECLFDTSHMTNMKGLENTTLLGAPHVINTSIGMCDIDIRPGLYNSVIAVGGNTLINGFVERLNRELLQKTPNNMRLKLVSNNQSSERRFSSWVGGSILASLMGNPHKAFAGTMTDMKTQKELYMGKPPIRKKDKRQNSKEK